MYPKPQHPLKPRSKKGPSASRITGSYNVSAETHYRLAIKRSHFANQEWDPQWGSNIHYTINLGEATGPEFPESRSDAPSAALQQRVQKMQETANQWRQNLKTPVFHFKNAAHLQLACTQVLAKTAFPLNTFNKVEVKEASTDRPHRVQGARPRALSIIISCNQTTLWVRYH